MGRMMGTDRCPTLGDTVFEKDAITRVKPGRVLQNVEVEIRHVEQPVRHNVERRKKVPGAMTTFSNPKQGQVYRAMGAALGTPLTKEQQRELKELLAKPTWQRRPQAVYPDGDMRHPASIWTEPANAEEDLNRMKNEYLGHLRGRARPISPWTVKRYEYTLTDFIRSLERHGDPTTLSSVTPAAVNRWVAEQRERGLAEEGIASALSALKVFTRRYVMEYLEYTTSDLLRKVPRFTPPEKPYEALTDEEQEALLDTYDRPTYEDTRNRAFVAVLLATGLRLSELLTARYRDLDRLTAELLVVGKGNRERTVGLSERAMKELRRYLRIRPEGEALFLTADGRPISMWGGQSIFRKLKAKSGVKRVHAHLLRHNFAQKALRNGAERGVLQDVLGHATPVMTNRYLGNERKRQAAQVMKTLAPI